MLNDVGCLLGITQAVRTRAELLSSRWHALDFGVFIWHNVEAMES